MKPNILICGKTGAGKTSLVQAMTDNLVPNSAIGDAEPKTKGFICYSTPLANYIDAEGMEPGQTVDHYLDFLYKEIGKRLESGRPENLIHCIWYCIDSSGGRVIETDRQLVSRLGKKVLVVMTKSDLLRENQQSPVRDAALQLVHGDKDRMIPVSTDTRKIQGLPRLKEQTEIIAAQSMHWSQHELAEYKQASDLFYQKKWEQWMSVMSEEADGYILWGAGRAAAIAIVPLPLVDVAPLLANEGYMIYRIAQVYGYDFDQTMATAFVGMLGGSFAGKALASFIPGAKIAIAYGVTYGVGVTAKAYFASGMKMSTEELKRTFNQNKNQKRR